MPSATSRQLSDLHAQLVHSRRAGVLVDWIDALLPPAARVLDIGSGDGQIGARLAAQRGKLQVEGVDVVARPNAMIPTAHYDGYTLPFEDASFDAVLLIDVLHHADNVAAVVQEAARVAPGCIVIKDHTPSSAIDYKQLQAMDWWANRSFGYALNYGYLSWPEWKRLFERERLRPERIEHALGLYPMPFGWIFDRGLHFIAKLSLRDAGDPGDD